MIPNPTADWYLVLYILYLYLYLYINTRRMRDELKPLVSMYHCVWYSPTLLFILFKKTTVSVDGYNTSHIIPACLSEEATVCQPQLFRWLLHWTLCSYLTQWRNQLWKWQSLHWIKWNEWEEINTIDIPHNQIASIRLVTWLSNRIKHLNYFTTWRAFTESSLRAMVPVVPATDVLDTSWILVDFQKSFIVQLVIIDVDYFVVIMLK